MIMLTGIIVAMVAAIWNERPTGFRLLNSPDRPITQETKLEDNYCIPCNDVARQEIEDEISRFQGLLLKGVRHIDPNYLPNLIHLLQTHTCDHPPGAHQRDLLLRPHRPLADEVVCLDN